MSGPYRIGVAVGRGLVPRPFLRFLSWIGRVRPGRWSKMERSEEHTSELQSPRHLPSFPPRRSSDLPNRRCRRKGSCSPALSPVPFVDWPSPSGPMVQNGGMSDSARGRLLVRIGVVGLVLSIAVTVGGLILVSFGLQAATRSIEVTKEAV